MHGRRIIPRIVVSAACAGGLVFLAWEFLIRSAEIPSGWNLPPEVTPVVTDLRGRPLAVRPTPAARVALPGRLRDFGPWLPAMTIAIEDHRFLTHQGVDWHALAGAALRNLRNGRTISGASTITQQLLKNAFPTGRRTLSAKIREMRGALRLERFAPKEVILEAYLNRLDYGNRRLGPEAAARAYFGKSARDLTLAEAIFLAGLPQSPTRLDPWKHPEAARVRYIRNVHRLEALGLLPEGADPAALLAAPPVVSRHDPPNEAPHFTELLPPTPTPEVRTSLDLDLQRATVRLLRAHLADVCSSNIRDAAVVVLDNSTGEVRALACAGTPTHSAINSAVEPRSSGSTLKPFLYLAAIERHSLTAATLLPDTPDAITTAYADYNPQNYSNRHHGPVRVREALGNSLNIPAVAALSRLGARDTYAALRGWGLRFAASFDAVGAGFILGNAQVRLLDLAAAYAALARGGMACPPRLTPHQAAETRRMASPEGCAIVTDILCDPAARRLTFGTHSALDVGFRTAVKTGTSSSFRDGWCVGFTAQHTVAVWAGNLDGEPMGEVPAVRSATPLWAALVRHLHACGDGPVPTPQPSATLRPLEVAATTGLLPRPGEPTVHEWFLAGTEPTEQAATWYVNDTLHLPPEYARWCASPQNHLGASVRSNGLQILFPREGATFLFNDSLPPTQQAILPQSSEPATAWFLNGERLTTPLVPLRRGRWTLTAQSAEKAVHVVFSVE